MKLNNVPEAMDNAKEMTSPNFLVRNVKIKRAFFTDGPTAWSLLFLFMVLKYVTLVRRL
jgi:hypothetical protein